MNVRFRQFRRVAAAPTALLLLALHALAVPLGQHRAPGGVAWANRHDIVDVAGTNRSTAAVTGAGAVSDHVLAIAWEQVVDGPAPAQGIMVALWDGGGSLPAFTNVMVLAPGTLTRFPRVEADGAGGFWIVAQAQVDQATNSAATLVVQHLQKTGDTTWTQRFGASGLSLTTTPAFFSEFAVFANADGCYVAWCGGSSSGSDTTYLRTQHVDAVSGLVQSGADGQTIVASAAQATSLRWTDHLAAGPILAWIRSSDDPFVKAVETATPPLNLNTGATDVTNPRWVNLLTMRGDNGQLVVYVVTCAREPRLRKLAFDAAGVATQLWDSSGVVVAPNLPLSTAAYVVPADVTGEVIVLYYVNGNADTARAQRFSSAGAPLWEATGRVLLDDSTPEPVIVPVGDGGFFRMDDVSNGGIRVQRFDANGAAVWSGLGRYADDTANTNTNIVGGAVLGDSVVAVVQWQRGSGAATRYGLTPVKLAVGTGLLPQSRLVNLSTRAPVGAGENVAVCGFFIGGDTGEKELVVRAVGPTLALPPFGVSGALADPVISLHASGGGLLCTADNWGGEANLADLIARMAHVGAFDMPGGSADAAILRAFDRGGYTAVVSGAQAATGIALLEAYDTDTGDTTTDILHDFTTGLRRPRLANISTRAVAGTGNDVVIVGFVVQGPGTSVVLARCVGATLGAHPFSLSGVLPDPAFDVHDRGNTLIFSHDDAGEVNPQNALSLQHATHRTGAFALSDAKDAAAVLVLNPGHFTIVARGVGGTSGVCLTELFDDPLSNIIP